MILIDLPLMLGTIVVMFTAAWLWDFLRTRLFREAGEQELRPSDRVLVNLLFFALTPGLLYAWFYPLVPFSGARAGLFLAVAFFLLAIAPTFAVYRLQAPGRPAASLGHLFWLLMKYLLVYGLLTQLYQP